MSRFTTKSATLAAEAFTVGATFFHQGFELRFLFGRKHGCYLRFPVLDRSAHLLVERTGAGLFFRSERALTSFFAKLSQFFTKSFAALETLLNDRADLLLLRVA